MGLSRRHEILFHAKVNLQLAVFEPAAAASREIRRLGGFGDSEDAVIELPRVALSACRHREQDMIQSANAHCFPFLARLDAARRLPPRSEGQYAARHRVETRGARI